MRRSTALILSLTAAACLSMQHPARSSWKNLHVLPSDISHDDLIATMRVWSQSLGVECNHCHVESIADGRRKLNFVSDAAAPKNITRAMVRMTRRMDADVAGVARNGATVSCYTCHRGKVSPDWRVPPPQPKA